MIKFFFKYCSIFFRINVLFVTPAKAIELFYPKNNVYINENLISFSWERGPSVIQSYNLVVSENIDLSAPIVDINIGTSSPIVNISSISGTT